MEDPVIINLYRRFQLLFQLPEGVEPNVTGLSTLLRLFKQAVKPQDFSQCNNYENALLVYQRKCLSNGFSHALYVNDKQSAKTCFDFLLNTVLNKVSLSHNDLVFSTERSVEDGSNSELDDAPVVKNSLKSSKCSREVVGASSIYHLDSKKHSSRNREIVSSRGELSSDTELEYTRKKNTFGHTNYPKLPIKTKRPYTRIRAKSYTSDESDIEREKVKNKKSRSISDSDVSNTQKIKKKIGKTLAKRKSKVNSDTEGSDSDVKIHRSKKYRHSKKQYGDTRSCDTSENSIDSEDELFGNSSSVCNKNSQKLKKDPKQPLTRAANNSDSNLLSQCAEVKKTNIKRRNKVQKETSEVAANASTKFIDRLKQLESSILKGSPDPLSKDLKKKSRKQTKTSESTSKNMPTKTNEKKNVSNKKANSAASKKNLNEENSLLDSSCPQIKNQKLPPVTNVSQTAEKKSAAKSTANTKNKKPPPETNKKTKAKVPTVQQIAKTDSKKPPIKKSQKAKIVKSPNQNTDYKLVDTSKKVTDSKSKSGSRQRNVAPKAKSQKPSTEETCSNARKTKTSVKEKVTEICPKNDESRQEKAKEEEKCDSVENESADKKDSDVLSSEDYLESEPELGTLSACLNSIKRKLPRQLGSATPPLKMFSIANSDILSEFSDDNSSFTDIPLKLDDKNVVKRMAKANKSKKKKDQPLPTFKKMAVTPSALRKIMKLKKSSDEDSGSEVECSSFCDGTLVGS